VPFELKSVGKAKAWIRTDTLVTNKELVNMNSKSILVFIVFLAIMFLIVAPYMRFVIQRHDIDSDLARISLDYSTMGRESFERRVHQICSEARLEDGSYEVEIVEDKNARSVTVTIRYQAELSLLFMNRIEEVELKNELTAYNL
jgi:hypothetical protein